MRSLKEWIEHRTGLETLVRNFLYEEIPASAGWHQVFGSIAVFLFLVQAFTGILLAFNYAPTPGDAYNSVKYIMSELTAGLIRGLHHWGASMMIAVVVLHMVQVFLYGAYKKPREATWMLGVVLLLATLAYGLTGYLLPWDNRAYWGTVVTVQIAEKAPLLGPYMARLLGDGNIGVVTFARFYALHVLLLPPLTFLLIASHIYLVRKHGAAPKAGDTGPKKPFFPEQVFKDTLAIFAAFAVLFTMAVAAGAPLERLADPTDTTYIPRPEWYFLFLFQTLKVFKGPLEAVGSVVLPSLAVLALLLTPFIDRGPLLRVAKRTVAIGVAVLALIGWTSLTVAAVVTTPAATVASIETASAPPSWQQLSPEELAGIGYFRAENCASCHTVGEGKAKIGPDLANVTRHKSAAWMIAHFKRPAQMIPGTPMPSIQLSDSELNTLAAFLLKLTPRNAKALVGAPAFAVDGAMIFQKSHCAACHTVNGTGMRLGPALNGLARRRSKEWVEKHFLNPAALTPGSVMPPYRFDPREMELITGYLMSLPG